VKRRAGGRVEGDITPRRVLEGLGERYRPQTADLYRQIASVRFHFLQALVVLLTVIVVGTAGYVLIEEAPWWDAFFMTMITITTVGYGEVVPLTRDGEIFTVALLVAGVGAGLYTINAVVRMALEGELTEALAEERMRRRIAHLHGHTILCGFGRVGEEIARALAERNEPFVVVDSEPAAVERAATLGYHHLTGDATHDDVLKAAGIARARNLIAAIDSDAANSWIVLSARALNQRLWIVVRADQPGSEAKLRHAGADRVISPPSIGGQHMALAAVQPLVLDFTQTLVRAHGVDLMLAQLSVAADSTLRGALLQRVLEDYPSLTVLGLKQAGGQLIVKPDPGLRLAPDDELIVLGGVEDLERINASARPRSDGGVPERR
jgi:voltage-gated potassium channel